MAAGVLRCSNSISELTWEGSTPSDVLRLGAKCGAGPEQSCPTSPADFLEFAERKKCRGTVFRSQVAFVCTGSLNQVKKAIEDLCKALFP